MKGQKQWLISGAVLLSLLAAWLIVTCIQSNQSFAAFPFSLSFEGEYRQNGGAWRPLTEDTKLNALDGDLSLRGHFSMDPSSLPVYFYLDHIYASVWINGTKVFEDEATLPDGSRGLCANHWEEWESPSISSSDLVEIRLRNLHQSGNPCAYEDFLKRMCAGSQEAFQNYLLHPVAFFSEQVFEKETPALWSFLISGQVWRTVANAILVLSLLTFGVAITDTLSGTLFGSRLWSMAFLSFFSGCTMWLDSRDISLVSRSLTFNTGAAQICRILTLLGLCLSVAFVLKGRWKKVACAGVAAVGVFDAGMTAAGLTGAFTVCDLTGIWSAVQAALCLLLFLGGIVSLRREFPHDKMRIGTLAALMTTVLLELLNAVLGLWPRGIMYNVVFVLILVSYLIWAVRRVPVAYRAERRAAEQEKELVSSRIAIMLSQIQPHFLYNALLVIQDLCHDKAPEAEQATIEFSRFLRCNLDSLQSNRPIPFERELSHTKNYLALEQKRFGERLHVEWDIETTAFLMPALTLQPIVENAVRYGVTKRENGGTVKISSKETPQGYEVTVTDDGIGFDVNIPHEDGRTHIGISNVEERLRIMCGGRLQITSTWGVGTVAVLTIPKEGKPA